MTRARIYIGEDVLNGDKEQFKLYQLDGVTVQVAIGKFAVVPLWVAQRAKEIGDIKDFEIVEA